MITKFLGMNISSKDPKRLALFYRDVLGLKGSAVHQHREYRTLYEIPAIQEIH